MRLSWNENLLKRNNTLKINGLSVKFDAWKDVFNL